MFKEWLLIKWKSAFIFLKKKILVIWRHICIDICNSILVHVPVCWCTLLAARVPVFGTRHQESLLESDGSVGGEFCLFVPCDKKKLLGSGKGNVIQAPTPEVDKGNKRFVCFSRGLLKINQSVCEELSKLSSPVHFNPVLSPSANPFYRSDIKMEMWGSDLKSNLL